MFTLVLLITKTNILKDTITMKTTKREQIVWIDLLRIVACFLVIIAHACDPFVGKTDSNYNEFFSGALMGSLVRACVPLFVMISGILLLPIKEDMISFYKKRTKRIITPFVFWAIMAPVMYYLYFKSGISTPNVNIVLEDFDGNSLITKLYTWIFNFNYDTIPLWYVYMLIGLYLFIPILSQWIKSATKKELKLVIFFWIITTCLPYIQLVAPLAGYEGNGGNFGLLGVCDWNAYGTFYYFSGFVGYLILAFYLVKYPLNWSWPKTILSASILFIASYGITFGGFLYTQKFYPENFSNLEIIWSFTGINVVIMTFSIFVVFQKIKLKASKLLRTMSNLTYGIFLCHFFFVQVSYDFIYPRLHTHPIVQIILVAVLTMALSGIVVWLLSLNKFTKRFVM